ncbi:MAG: fructose-1,6-bisphosphatase [Eubacteriales bacterium]|nr:fructose-1,6-bisphosphatase [Eubacteriales bacterium]
MRDLDYLLLLSKQFKNIRETSAEIINLYAILDLPKGTEYFFSDLHGEYESFIHLLRSASGVIKQKIYDLFGLELSQEDILSLANLIYFPKEKLKDRNYNDKNTFIEQKRILKHLVPLVKKISQKYSKSKIRKLLPKEYAYIIEELIFSEISNDKKELFYDDIYNYIIEIGVSKDFIICLCDLIQRLSVDSLHILGDIFDRGPRPDYIMDELIDYGNVDFEWGNHDAEWIGAYLGNEALICSVMRMASRYNTFDVLEDGYNINLRPLSMIASTIYKDDPCTLFYPHILDENQFDLIEPQLAAKMQKMLAIMQFKLEGQLIKKHPEYGMDNRIMLERINYDEGVIDIDGKKYKLKTNIFPTINKNDPLKLSKEEEELISNLKLSFMHSKKLQEHIKFLITHGSMYKIINGNLLYHGCIPFDNNAEFLKHYPSNEKTFYSGKKLLDYFNEKILEAYYNTSNKIDRQRAIDRMWYLWCGPKSPLFGKDKITTFEKYFIDDEATHKEIFNPYYDYINDKKMCIKILEEFGLNENGHIVNGHVPVKVGSGESPVKGGGKLFVIDGGISKSYQEKTGIAGYTMIYDSVHITIATHKPYKKDEDNTPDMEEVKTMSKDRLRVKDTDNGIVIKRKIKDLRELLKAYREGIIKES